jgi:hypothetical protein
MKKIEFSKIIPGQSTTWRLEIQYKSIDKIHPDHLRDYSSGKIPIIFSKESTNYQEILDCARRMSSIYSTDDWNYVTGIINTTIGFYDK